MKLFLNGWWDYFMYLWVASKRPRWPHNGPLFDGRLAVHGQVVCREQGVEVMTQMQNEKRLRDRRLGF